MAVYLAAGAMALIYLLATPVRVGIAWKTGGKARFGLSVGPFRMSAHGGLVYVPGTGLIADLKHDRSGKKRELRLSAAAFDPASFSPRLAALRSALRYLLSHAHVHRLKAVMHISLPDAARTALIYGFFDSSLRALRAVRPGLPLTASVTADFRSGRTRFDLCGILSFRLGHIMAAGLIALRDYLSGRIHTWTTSSRSKAL